MFALATGRLHMSFVGDIEDAMLLFLGKTCVARKKNYHLCAQDNPEPFIPWLAHNQESKVFQTTNMHVSTGQSLTISTSSGVDSKTLKGKSSVSHLSARTREWVEFCARSNYFQCSTFFGRPAPKRNASRAYNYKPPLRTENVRCRNPCGV